MTKFGKFKKAPSLKKKKSWTQRHRVGIVKVSTTAGLFAGGVVGLGGAIMARGMIPAELILVPSVMGGAISANVGARKVIRTLKKRRQKKR